MDVERASGTLLAHEWLAPVGGSENVFEQLRAALPGARAVCLWNENPERFPDVEETWLARTPLRRSKALALPFLHRTWAGVPLAGVERVVVSSHALAHHLASRAAEAGIPSYAYVHTPPRYLWNPELDPRGDALLGRLGRAWFRRADRRSVSAAVHHVTNSRYVADRVARAWGVSADVIYPPVAVERIQSCSDWTVRSSVAEQERAGSLPREFVLGASRLVGYKRLYAAIDTGEAVGLPVVIAGDGPLRGELEERARAARVPVHFVGRVSDAALYGLYQRALLFVFLAVEDLGLMPAEAIAAGTPVLVNARGGAPEIVELTGGGVVVESSDRGSLREAARAAIALPMEEARRRVQQLGVERFRSQVTTWVETGSVHDVRREQTPQLPGLGSS